MPADYLDVFDLTIRAGLGLCPRAIELLSLVSTDFLKFEEMCSPNFVAP